MTSIIAEAKTISLVVAFNAAIQAHSLPVSPVQKFANRATAEKRVLALCDEYGLIPAQADDGSLVLFSKKPADGTDGAPGEGQPSDAQGDGTTDEGQQGTEDGTEPSGDGTTDDASGEADPKPLREQIEEAAKARKAKSKGTGRRGPAPEYADHFLVEVITEGGKNPKKGASAVRFEGYFGAKTVADALKAGVTRADLRWDADRSLVRITDPAAPLADDEDGTDSSGLPQDEQTGDATDQTQVGDDASVDPAAEQTGDATGEDGTADQQEDQSDAA